MEYMGVSQYITFTCNEPPTEESINRVKSSLKNVDFSQLNWGQSADLMMPGMFSVEMNDSHIEVHYYFYMYSPMHNKVNTIIKNMVQDMLPTCSYSKAFTVGH